MIELCLGPQPISQNIAYRIFDGPAGDCFISVEIMALIPQHRQ
jgi:hypothetical protein